jgi:nucleoid-associated protein EbfC
MAKSSKENKMDFNIGDLLKNFKNMQESLGQIQQKMKSTVVTGSAGGEMVKIEMNCAFELLSVSISPEALDPVDVALLQDLVKAALNNALSNAKEKIKETAGPLAAGMNLPFGFPG